MSENQTPEMVEARFEELNVLKEEFEEVDLEIIRKAEVLQTPLYKKRATVVAKIPHFWPLVFEQAPPEIDNFIQPSDSKLFAECLETFEVTRFELNDPKGSPRSFSLKFGFKENEYLEDKVLEKKFWFRKTMEWQGLVSEPVKINWKKGQDPTGGLTDAAYNLGEARKKLATDTSSAESRKKEASLPEYKALSKAMEESAESSVSFFGIFAFVSGYRYVSAEESEKTDEYCKKKVEQMKAGEKMDEDEPEEEDDGLDHQEVEVFPGGDEVATLVAEDMWPNAIKYYMETFEAEEDDEELSEIDFEEDDAMEDDDSDAEVDIRALVGKGRKDGQSPPAKKQRKH